MRVLMLGWEFPPFIGGGLGTACQGLTALEAIRCGVPTIISKTSGVAEILQNSVLKTDFWDVDRMADMIIAVLTRPEIAESLRGHAGAELRGLTWGTAAWRCLGVYSKCLELEAA